MDWLLPEPPPVEMIAVFELLLDRLACQLDITVVCAYRHSSFDTAATAAALSVHRAQSGREEEEPPYRLVSGTAQTWRLAGEIDLSAGPAFAAALSAAADLGDCIVDVAGGGVRRSRRDARDRHRRPGRENRRPSCAGRPRCCGATGS